MCGELALEEYISALGRIQFDGTRAEEFRVVPVRLYLH